MPAGCDVETCGCHANIKNLVAWQEKQNGTLQRLESKVDGLKTWLISLLVAAVVDLAVRVVGRG